MAIALAAMAAAAGAQPAKPTAMENPYAGAPKRSEIAEARRLVKTGKELQAANIRRREAEKTSNAQSMDDLVPRYIKAAPSGWSVDVQGFVYDIVRPDGAQICRAIDDMRKDDSFYCSPEDQGQRHRLVVPF